MADPQQNDRPPVSLEQLLRLKRSERPDAHFWEEFDRELHRRQLASVVARPLWHVRLARSFFAGLRRSAPLGAAAVAAVAGFMVLQRPTTTDSTPVAAAQQPAVPAQVAAEVPSIEADYSLPDEIAVAALAETPEPAFERPVAGEPRFVVHEFVASVNPARTFVSITSPNTFSAPTYDSGLQTVNTLSSGTGRFPSAHAGAGSF